MCRRSNCKNHEGQAILETFTNEVTQAEAERKADKNRNWQKGEEILQGLKIIEVKRRQKEKLSQK